MYMYLILFKHVVTVTGLFCDLSPPCTNFMQRWQRKYFRLDARGDLYYFDNEKVLF